MQACDNSFCNLDNFLPFCGELGGTGSLWGVVDGGVDDNGGSWLKNSIMRGRKQFKREQEKNCTKLKY